jgi:phage shock protein PspC (stress-responsive transcriptional regulator)
MIDGICGGVAEYFGIDSTLVRVAAVLLAFAGGIGVVLYFVAMIIMPSPLPGSQAAKARPGGSPGFLIGGIVLIVVGLVWFLAETDVYPFHFHFWDFSELLFAALLILAGLLLLVRGRNAGEVNQTDRAAEGSSGGSAEFRGEAPKGRLYRVRVDRKLFGVCGGLAEYFGIDPTIVRIAFIASAFVSLGVTLLAYVLLSILVPRKPFPFSTPAV